MTTLIYYAGYNVMKNRYVHVRIVRYVQDNNTLFIMRSNVLCKINQNLEAEMLTSIHNIM